MLLGSVYGRINKATPLLYGLVEKFKIRFEYSKNLSNFTTKRHCRKMDLSKIKDWVIVQDFAELFSAAQFSTVVIEEIRKEEVIYKEPLPPGEQKVKVMSYNVLAQDLLEEHSYLYSNNVREALLWEKRKELLLKEILTADPDILSMQEVQDSHIGSFYSKLEDYGYKGVFKRRTGGQSDGCAVYYKTSVFKLLDWTSVEYNQPDVRLLNRPNIGLILRLATKNSSSEILVANTHLLYNPKRWDVRLAQIQILLAELNRMSKSSEDHSPAFLLMGDLNSPPFSPLVTLLNEGSVDLQTRLLPTSMGILNDCTHAGESKLYNRDRLVAEVTSGKSSQNNCDIETNPADKYKKNNEDEKKLSHKFNFSSVYNIKNESFHKPVTTHHDDWVTVDYIFYSNLRLLSRLRLPTAEQCSLFIKQIPNEQLPSDHFSLVATFSIL